jgi:hypothetical protein
MIDEPPPPRRKARSRQKDDFEGLATRLTEARCALCRAGGFVVEVATDSKSVTRGLVRVGAGHICPDCAREASARYARMVRRISNPTE